MNEKQDYEIQLESTDVSDEDINNGIKDEYGVVYSRDFKRLLSARLIDYTCTQYTVKPGTHVICDKAFNYYNTDRLETVEIPNSVKAIGNNSFSRCRNLHSINIPSSVTSIGNYAFRDCSKLESIDLPDSIVSIGDYAFVRCKLISHIRIPKNLIKIGKNPFASTYLSNVDCRSSYFKTDGNALYTKDGEEIISVFRNWNFYNIPETVKSIRDNAFSTSGLKTVVIPKNVKNLGNYVFVNSRIKSIEIPETVNSIGKGLFYYCTKLTSIKLPYSITTIEDYMFCECHSLQSIEIPKAVKRIGDSAFEMCHNLQTVILPEFIESIGKNCFYCCWNLKSIVVPKGTISKFKEMLGEHALLLKETDNRQ